MGMVPGIWRNLTTVNLAIDVLAQDLPIKRDNVTLFQLMETTKSYITKHTLLTKKKSQTVSRTPQKSRISTQLNPPAPPISNKLKQQESNLSPNFTKLKSWYEYVKQTIGTHGFLNELNLESGIKLTKSINQRCYHCRLNNHTHENCEPLKEYKRLALLA